MFKLQLVRILFSKWHISHCTLLENQTTYIGKRQIAEAGAWFVIDYKSEPRGDEVIPVIYYTAAVTENTG